MSRFSVGKANIFWGFFFFVLGSSFFFFVRLQSFQVFNFLQNDICMVSNFIAHDLQGIQDSFLSESNNPEVFLALGGESSLDAAISKAMGSCVSVRRYKS